MLPNFQAGAKAVEDDRVTRERPGEIEGKATGKMEAARASVRNTTMPFRNKIGADRSHHLSPAVAGIALVASIGVLTLHETMTEAHRNHSTNDLSEMVTGLRQAQAREVRGQAKMIESRLDLPMRRKHVSRTKEFEHMEITLGSSRREPDQDDPEIDL